MHRQYSPLHQREEDVSPGADVLHGGRPAADLTPKDVVEDLGGVLLTLQSVRGVVRQTA